MEKFINPRVDKYGHWKYPIKVWITTFLSAPFFMGLLSTQPNVMKFLFSVDFLEFFFFVVVLGSFLTLPGMLLLWLCSSLSFRWRMTPAQSKPLFILISILCCISMFVLFSLRDLSSFWKAQNVYFMSTYAIPLTMSLLFISGNKYKKNADKNRFRQPLVAWHFQISHLDT